MVCILVELVHIDSLESTMKRKSFCIFARDELENQISQNELVLTKYACRHKILSSGKEMRRGIIVPPKYPKRPCQNK